MATKNDGTEAYQAQSTSITSETLVSSTNLFQIADGTSCISPITNYLQTFNVLKTNLNIGNALISDTVCDISNFKVSAYTDLLTTNINGCFVNNGYKGLLIDTGCNPGFHVGVSDGLSIKPYSVSLNSIMGSGLNCLSVNSDYNPCALINNSDYGFSSCSINRNSNLFVKGSEFKVASSGSNWFSNIGLNNDGLYSIKSDYLSLNTTINDYGLNINSGICFSGGTSLFNTDGCFGVLNAKASDFGSLLHAGNFNVGTIFEDHGFGIKDFGLGVAHSFLNNDNYLGTTIKINNLYSDFNITKAVPLSKSTEKIAKILNQLTDNFGAEHFGYNCDTESDGTINVHIHITVTNITGTNAHIGNNYYNKQIRSKNGNN
jgi:hypothetical protein